MSGGVSAQGALAMAGGVATALTAAGTTTTDALVLAALDTHMLFTMGARIHASSILRLARNSTAFRLMEASSFLRIPPRWLKSFLPRKL